MDNDEVIVIEQQENGSYVFPPIPEDVGEAVKLLQRIRLKPSVKAN